MTDLEYDFFTKQDVKICVDKKDKTQYRVKILTNNPITILLNYFWIII
jgi:hypothetical protein